MFSASLVRRLSSAGGVAMTFRRSALWIAASRRSRARCRQVVTGLVLACALPLTVPRPCAGQTFHPPLGDVYLSFDSAAPPTTCAARVLRPPAWVPFRFYLGIDIDWSDVGQPERNAADGAAGMEVLVRVPEGHLVVTARTFRFADSEFKTSGGDNFIVDFGGACVTGNDGPTWIVIYTCLFVGVVEEGVVSLGPAEPSIFASPGGPGPTAGWAACGPGGDLYPFDPDYASQALLYINQDPCGVPAATASFGMLKAAYDLSR